MVDEQVFENLSVEDIAKLGDFVSDPRGDTFVVRLPAGIAGATFARYSRAKGGWRTTFLKEFLAEGQLDPDGWVW
jgi:hypothetical protein